MLADGTFHGTLCAIDPARRSISGGEVIAAMEVHAKRVGEILSGKPTVLP
ncbi:hypothetical protein WG907_12590 [Sphingobium sp. AN558]